MCKISRLQKFSPQWVDASCHQAAAFLVFLSLLAVLLVPPAQAQSRGITINPVASPLANAFDKGIYRALIIGNDDYDDPKNYWPELTTAVSDARAVADMLENGYGFTDVVVLENSTRREILHALNDLGQRVQTNDNVLLYYAGHGFLDDSTQKGYWVPSDAEGTDHTTFLRNSTIRDEVGILASRAKHTLLISDSCFSGTLLRGGLRGAPPTENVDRYYKKVASKKSVQVLAAGGVEYVDDNYKKSGHSPFSYFLINELKHNDKALLTASELASNVEKAVANNVDQVPTSGVLQGAGDELGEFIFIKVNIVVDGIDKERVKVKVDVAPKDEVSTNASSTIVDKHEPDDGGKPGGEEFKHSTMPLPSL